MQRTAPIVVATTSAPATPVFKPATPPAQTTDGRTVIASTWQPLQRVSAEQDGTMPAGGERQPIAETPAPLSLTAAGASDVPPAQLLLPAAPIANQESVEVVPDSPADQTRLAPEASVAATVADHPLHHAAAIPREDSKQSHPVYRVEPPDILLIQASRAITLAVQAIDGPHLVRSDGTISLGVYGTVYVAGLTLEEIRDSVAAKLKAFRDQIRASKYKMEDEKGKPIEVELKDYPTERIKIELTVDVIAYNSKVYYVITDGGGYGEQVYRFVSEGNETVLDAIAKIQGLPAVASKKRIWLARATPGFNAPQVYPVDWCAITKMGAAGANYQVFPGDRIYVNSDKRIAADSFLAKTLAPIERVLGVTLLGSSTVNSIRNGGTSTGTGTGTVR